MFICCDLIRRTFANEMRGVACALFELFGDGPHRRRYALARPHRTDVVRAVRPSAGQERGARRSAEWIGVHALQVEPGVHHRVRERRQERTRWSVAGARPQLMGEIVGQQQQDGRGGR